MDFGTAGSHGRFRRAGADGHRASGRGDAVARHRRARRLRGQSAADAVPHLAARRLCRSAFAGDHAAHRRHVEDGRLRPAAHRAADLRRADCRHAHAAAGARRRHRGDGRVGRGRAKRSEARLRLLLGESPRLLPARHLRAGRSGFRRSAAGQPGRGAQRRHPADVQPRHHRGGALLVHRHDPVPHAAACAASTISAACASPRRSSPG